MCQADSIIILMDVSSGLHNYKRESSGPRNDHTMECQVELHNYFKGCQVDPVMILMDVSSGLHNYKKKMILMDVKWTP